MITQKLYNGDTGLSICNSQKKAEEECHCGPCFSSAETKRKFMPRELKGILSISTGSPSLWGSPMICRKKKLSYLCGSEEAEEGSGAQNTWKCHISESKRPSQSKEMHNFEREKYQQTYQLLEIPTLEEK